MTVIIEPGVSNTDAAFADPCRVCREDPCASNGKFPYRARIVRNCASDLTIVDETQTPSGLAPLFTALIVGTRMAEPVSVTDVNRTVSAEPPVHFDAFYEPAPEGRNT